MPLHDDLLALARRLVPPLSRSPALAPLPPSAPVAEVDLRRGVSTAYYALFHLLIHEATMRIVADPSLRSRVGRSFEHGRMLQVCQEYSEAAWVANVLTLRRGASVVPQLRDIGIAFVELHKARQDADYDVTAPLNHSDADYIVTTAETAFLNWAACQANASSGVFLTDLFLKSVLRNRG